MVAAALTYKVKFETQRRYQEVQRIERQIDLERDNINLLRTDFALLTQPARIQHLVTQYHDQLGLQVTEPWQIVKLTDIPKPSTDTIQNIIQRNDNNIGIIQEKILADIDTILMGERWR